MDGVTLFMTSLSEPGQAAEISGVNISSLVDTWLLLRNQEADAERTRTFSIVKSRGMAHSRQTHQFEFDSKGIHFAGATTGTR